MRLEHSLVSQAAVFLAARQLINSSSVGRGFFLVDRFLLFGCQCILVHHQPESPQLVLDRHAAGTFLVLFLFAIVVGRHLPRLGHVVLFRS